MKTLKLTLAYDGTDFAGWQVQPAQRSVQGELEAAAGRITGSPAAALASGRTDAGVHALGQVVRLRAETHLPADVLHRALNAELPDDVAVLEIAEADEHFHPIRDATAKRYRYLIHDGPTRQVLLRRYAWDYRHGRLDVPAMQRAAESLRGRHDFASFQTAGAERATTVRDVRHLSVERLAQPEQQGVSAEQGRVSAEQGRVSAEQGRVSAEQGGVSAEQGRVSAEQGGAGGALFATPLMPPGDWIRLEIEADGFLYNMVRAIVGTLVEVGRGAQAEHWPGDALAARDRRQAGPTAPPQGLFLVRVVYP